MYDNSKTANRNLDQKLKQPVPELPDIVVYIEVLEKRILGQTLEKARIASPFLLRTAVPPLSSAEGQRVRELRRIGKRIAIGFENEVWLVLHLMIAGRLHWKKRGVKVSPPRGLAAFDFPSGTLLSTEAGSKSGPHCMLYREKLRSRGLTLADWKYSLPMRGEFYKNLIARNHTLKRAFTDPRIFSGIGNAVLGRDSVPGAAFAAGPYAQTQARSEVQRLFHATRARSERTGPPGFGRKPPGLPRKGDRLPRRHGRTRTLKEALSPMRRQDSAHPLCSNETNYCPTCQTGGVCSRTARYRDCCATTGRAPRKNWR